MLYDSCRNVAVELGKVRPPASNRATTVSHETRGMAPQPAAVTTTAYNSTHWEPKEFDIILDFLEDGEYHMEFIEDGINADTRAIDYLKKSQTVKKGDLIHIKLAPGGGWVARMVKSGS